MLSADLLSWEMGKEKQERSMEMYNWQLWNKLLETGEEYGDVQLVTSEQTSKHTKGSREHHLLGQDKTSKCWG